jgi:enoyl-CoA hydratase/carnithine racemase
VSAETVVVEHHGPVLRVRMNRPDKLNAQKPTLITELDTAFAAREA